MPAFACEEIKRSAFMKIEVFEIRSKEDKIYQELLEQYKTNLELRGLLNEDIIPSELIWAGDFRLITTLDMVIEDWDNIKVYLVKDVDNDTFVWAIGKFERGKDSDKHSALINMTMDEKDIIMYPLLRKQSKKLQLAIRKALIEKGLMKEIKRNKS
jgi:hypothetical protein